VRWRCQKWSSEEDSRRGSNRRRCGASNVPPSTVIVRHAPSSRTAREERVSHPGRLVNYSSKTFIADKRQKTQRSPAMYAIVLVAAYLAYQVLQPFFAPLIWAAVFAVLFHGWQVALSKKIGPNAAALLTTVVAGVIIIAPAIMLVSAVAREV